jgi:putative acetyltransferase
VLFSPATIESRQIAVPGMALAPMAVLPECQRQGIGSKLVRSGIEKLEKRRCPFVIVMGHPEYYPRFGFEPASCYGIRSEWEVSDDVFMILVLNGSKMKGVCGLAKYGPEFTEEL